MITCIEKTSDKPSCPFSILGTTDSSGIDVPSVDKLEPVDASNTLLLKMPIAEEIRKFKLPIAYLDASDLYTLNETVCEDLELYNGRDNNMYSYLFQPTHSFAKYLIPEWKKQYTTHTGFLQETQAILRQFGEYKTALMVGSEAEAYKPDCDKLTEIWNAVKRDDYFLDKYSYVDWEQFKYLNQSEAFLQLVTYLNLSSPLVSLFIPVVLMVFPFILLKFQNIPISFSTYLETLKAIAKNHFIGKTLFSMESLSWDRVVYLLFTIFMYGLQIYQNINKCCSFYKNTKKINEYLMEMQKYTKYSIQSMQAFLGIAQKKTHFVRFCIDVETHCKQLQKMEEQLKRVTEFSPDLTKVCNAGYMLKCFYDLHDSPEYEASLRFSMGFEAYMDNMNGVFENLACKHVNYVTFDTNQSCSFKKQYYPPLKFENPVRNDCDLQKNIILSAPNKSGKTTVLKTTTLNIIFTQQLGCGFYAAGVLQPYTHIHSYINIPDTSGRDSLFQAESRRCKDILDIIIENNDAAKHRHFCIFDELYSGTNPVEASKAGYAFLTYLGRFPNVKFMLTTHYLSICKKFKKSENVENYKMRVNVLEDGAFEYTYKMQKGISKRKGALQVLKDMDYPAEIIHTMESDK